MGQFTNLSGRERQQQLNAQISINGVPDLVEFLKGNTIEIRPELAKLFGGTTTPTRYDAVVRGAELNDVSFERELLSDLLNEGYSFTELEIEVNREEEAAWGKMLWYPEHENYKEPAPSEYVEAFKRKFFVPEYYFATFKTENAGDQSYCLYSTQMFMSSCILLHKTILYHRAVLNPPK